MKIDNLDFESFYKEMSFICDVTDVWYLIYKILRRYKFEKNRMKFEIAYNRYENRFKKLHPCSDGLGRAYVLIGGRCSYMNTYNLKSAIYNCYNSYIHGIYWCNKNNSIGFDEFAKSIFDKGDGPLIK